MGAQRYKGPPRQDIGQAMQAFDLRANQAGFVGHRIAPLIDTAEQAGGINKIRIADLLKKRQDTRRAPDGTYQRGTGGFDADTFATVERGFEERLDEREVRRLGGTYPAEELAALRSQNQVLQDYEAAVIETALAAIPGGQITAIATPWSSAATAIPVKNITDAVKAFRRRVGRLPTSLLIDWECYQALRDCSDIISRLSANDDRTHGDIQTSDLARALDIGEIIISGGMQNTSAAAVGDGVLTPVWDPTKALLFIASQSEDLLTPRFMNTIHWTGDGSMLGKPGSFEAYYSDERRSDVVRYRIETQEKVLYSLAATLLTGVMA